jgi:hypothetical protein
MRYTEVLKFLEKRTWKKLAGWLERSIGPRTGGFHGFETVQADLAISGSGDHLLLVQAGILVWIAEGRPTNQPAQSWSATKKDIIADFQAMSVDQLGKYLDESQLWLEPAPVVVAQPVVVQPVRRPPPPPPGRPVMNTPAPRGNVNALASTLGSQIPAAAPRLNVGHAVHAPVSHTHAVTTPTAPSANRVVPHPPPPRARRLSKGPAKAPSSATELRALVEKMADLKNIVVSDIPLGYKKYLTEKLTNDLAEAPRGFLKDLAKRKGWLDVGKSVLTNKVGKCWGCASAAIYKLVADGAFDGVVIESMGVVDNDHHFVAVNRDSSTDVTKMSTWNAEAFIVDPWQANRLDWTTRAAGTPTKSQLCWSASDYPYKDSTMKSFCGFEPKDRTADRESLQAVGKSLHGAGVATGLAALQKCFVNHVSAKKKFRSACVCTGWCDTKDLVTG